MHESVFTHYYTKMQRKICSLKMVQKFSVQQSALHVLNKRCIGDVAQVA